MDTRWKAGLMIAGILALGIEIKNDFREAVKAEDKIAVAGGHLVRGTWDAGVKFLETVFESKPSH